MKNIYVVIILLIISSFFVINITQNPSIPKQDIKLKEFPEIVGDWIKVKDIGVDTKVIQILGTGDVISRVYKNSKDRKINIVVVRATNNRSAFHPPEYCLTGSGLRLIDKTIANVTDTLRVNRMTYEDESGSKLLVYNWYLYGKSMTTNFYKQQINLLINQLKTGYGNGTVVNIYGSSKGDILELENDNSDFSRSLITVMGAIYE